MSLKAGMPRFPPIRSRRPLGDGSYTFPVGGPSSPLKAAVTHPCLSACETFPNVGP